MKTNKKSIGTKRRIMDKKIQPWLRLRSDRRPPSGWLKAVRGALGLSSRQLAWILGTDSSVILRMEAREPEGKMTLELLDRTAKAMGCKVVYAIVPDDPYESLESIVDHRAKIAATELIQKVEHSMRLEDQGSPDAKAEIETLTQELKQKMDARVWGTPKPKPKPMKKRKHASK